MNAKQRIWRFLLPLALLLASLTQLAAASRTQASALWATSSVMDTTRHVAPNGTDSGNDCIDSNNPCQTIQHGIDVAADGNTVLVQPGTYVENINFNGKNIKVKSTDGPDVTIIDGNQNGSVVMFVNGEDASAELNGFTVTNGTGSPDAPPRGVNGRTHGGGIWCYNDASPTLVNLKITGNEGHHGGGIGVWDNSSPTLINVLLANNEGSWGGALGIWFGASPTLINVTISGHSAYMGDVFFFHDGSVSLTNTIIWDNDPEVFRFFSGSNSATVSYSNVQGGQSGGPINWLDGNIEASPLFVDAANGDYRLSDNSPAIGAGTLQNAPATDIEGNPRPNPAGSNPDMGAYETPPAQIPGDGCVAPPPGIVAWWPLDETSGTTAADLIGTHNGTYINDPTPVSGMVDWALDFDGVDDYVEVPNAPEINFGTGDFTMDAWIKTELASGYTFFLDKQDGAVVGYEFGLENGRLFLQLGDASGYSNYTNPNSPNLADGEWHFVAVTIDRDDPNGGKLYADGQVIHTFNPTSRSGTISNNVDLWIGKHRHWQREFDGAVDEVELFNRVLTPQEILSIYNAGSAGKCKDANDDEQSLLACEGAEGYPGDTLLVDLIASGTNVYGLQVNSAVDPAIAAPQSATFGNFFDSPYLAGINHADVGAGTWDGAASQQNPNPPVTGSGTFATVSYQAISPGSSEVTLTPLFSSRDGFELDDSASSCVLTVLDFARINGTVTYQGRLTHADIDVVATGLVTNNDLTDSNGDFEIGGLKGGDYQVKADVASYLPACAADVPVISGDITSLPATRLLGGDVNDDVETDLVINIGDFTRLTASFGEPAATDTQADINADGTINVQDLSILGGNYDVSGCQVW